MGMKYQISLPHIHGLSLSSMIFWGATIAVAQKLTPDLIVEKLYSQKIKDVEGIIVLKSTTRIYMDLISTVTVRIYLIVLFFNKPSPHMHSSFHSTQPALEGREAHRASAS